jgi:hypothetical protein
VTSERGELGEAFDDGAHDGGCSAIQ